MFGEYAVYLDGKVVALVCDDRLYIKVHPVTTVLAGTCELGPPFPGAKPYYVLDEGDWASRDDLAPLLMRLAAELPVPKKRKASASKANGQAKKRGPETKKRAPKKGSSGPS